MKSRVWKKVLTGALAVSLAMAPAIGANASGAGSGAGSGTGTVSGNGVSDKSTGQTVSVAEIPTTSTVKVNGTAVKTTTAGIYLAKSVNGSVVLTDTAAITAGYGLTGNEKPYVKISDMDKKKSVKAMASIEAAASAIGATVGPCLNIELGKLSGGKYSLLAQDGADIRLAFGIPKSFAQPGMAYAVICVRPGGAVSILKDVDEDPDTITFDTKGGAGAYAIVKYPAA